MNAVRWTAVCLLGVLIPALCVAQEPARGVRRVGPQNTGRYREVWALIIGVNYKGRQVELTKVDQNVLPQLNNAVNDAEAFADVLGTYYGSAEEKLGYHDDAHLRVVLEEEATEGRIKDEIERLCDPNLVDPQDSVLVYFAGHAVRLDDQSRQFGDAVALLPYDVKLSGGKVIGNTVGLPYELVSWLMKVPAQHKLLVLDCCFSGEIFELPAFRDGIAFKPRGSVASDRSDPTLQFEPAFQALASCRRTQTASDGERQHSPFTTALVDGLKRLPARTPKDRRVWSSRLLFHIIPNFEDRSQKPDCRNLVGMDGEFCFHPSQSASFDAFMVTANEETLLQASVASRQGSWWFDEMPWFIPSIRDEILKPLEAEKKRSSTVVDLIEPKALLNLTRSFVGKPRADGSLEKMRSRHANSLLHARETKEYRQTLESIRDELLLHYRPPESATRSLASQQLPTEQFDLAAADIHLLAVLYHALGEEDSSRSTYEHAIQRYDDEIARQERSLLRILQALCQADLGEFLLGKAQAPEEAAEQFRLASLTMRKLLGSQETEQPGRMAGDTRDGTGIFEVYVLCREADAWLRLSHWEKANDCLKMALYRARSLAPVHYLTAHVNRRRAWSEIIQWRIKEAERSFIRSNAILSELFLKELELQSTVTEDAPAAGVGDRPMTAKKSATDVGSYGDVFALPAAYYQSTDFASKISFLHNLHGIAMAQRFQGDAPGAAQSYRALVDMVEATYADFQRRLVDADVNDRLLSRIINTQERLGDCNLFGNPEARDLKEALDDYRRAMHRVHMLKEQRARDRWKARLLYKKALVLSLPSSVEDTELAVEMCQRADEIFATQQAATDLNRALGRLATPMVELLRTRMDPTIQPDDGAPAAQLRAAILEFRDLIGASPHRDELELGLFASKVLLEYAGQSGRYQALEDADLLLSFCRIGLSPYRGDSHRSTHLLADDAADSRAYLRPYYDAVMRAKLRLAQKDVRDLLEIQREATLGTYYVKRRNVMPVLAIYILDGECYLLFDVPSGESKCVSLSDMYDIKSIKNACYATDRQRLPLPRRVSDSLAQWWQRESTLPMTFDQWQLSCCWWTDPVRGLTPSQERVVLETSFTDRPAVHNRLERKGRFPFELPFSFSTDATEASAPSPSERVSAAK